MTFLISISKLFLKKYIFYCRYWIHWKESIWSLWYWRWWRIKLARSKNLWGMYVDYRLGDLKLSLIMLSIGNWFVFLQFRICMVNFWKLTICPMKMILTSLIVILMEFCFLKNGKNILLKNIRNFKLFFQLKNQDMMNKSKSCNYLKFIFSIHSIVIV